MNEMSRFVQKTQVFQHSLTGMGVDTGPIYKKEILFGRNRMKCPDLKNKGMLVKPTLQGVDGGVEVNL